MAYDIAHAAWFDRDHGWNALPVMDFLNHHYRAAKN